MKPGVHTPGEPHVLCMPAVHGRTYQGYAARVGRFVPGPSRFPDPPAPDRLLH
jgi:hypothetical protein